jgi:hypothetical protein
MELYSLVYHRLRDMGAEASYERVVDAVDASLAMISGKTGWSRLLAEPGLRVFDPPGTTIRRFQDFKLYSGVRGSDRYLYVPEGVHEIYWVKVVGQDWSNSDYWISEHSNPFPALGIEFRAVPYGDSRCIQVSGLFGAFKTLPIDLSEAVQALAVSKVLRDRSLTTGGMVSWRDADVSEEYGLRGAYAAQIEQQLAIVDDVVARYRRPVLWS